MGKETQSKIWAISDIHGCYREMMALMKQIEKAGLDYKKDKVIFLGDYMDRGPDSKKVVDQLMKWHKLYPHWVFLYGNHEDIFRNWINGEHKYREDFQWSCYLANGGVEGLQSFGLSEAVRSGIPKKYLDFLFKETKILHEEENYVFVHGGLIPNTPLEEIKKLLSSTTKERETIAYALIWARYEFIGSDYDWGKKVIFGHTADYAGKYYNPKNSWGKNQKFMPIVKKNKIGIDGACCPPANKNLIALELPAEKFYFQESFHLYDLLTNL